MRKNPISKLEVERVKDIIEDIKCGKLEKEHPLQRHGGGIWSTEQMSNLIRRVLHDGKFLPILICTQYDKNGCEVYYLIDGLQRITTFESYMIDDFPISKNTIDYKVSYDGILYETKQLKSGKFALKRDKNKNLIPILDEDGKQQRVEQTIDIRGLRYSELPPELQEKIKRYVVSVQYKLECTDEDIQIEILDYNSGTKMNDAQIGKNRLGTEFARIVTELSKHSFIKNKCGFTHDNRIKGVIDRAINESLMLVNFGTDEWVTNHKDLCRRLSNWLTVENTNNLREMFDDLDVYLPEDDDIKEYLTLKEFFVVMANYKHFLEKDYKKECYAMFLSDFVKTLSMEKNIPTGEIDEEGNEIFGNFRTVYMTGTKQKNMVEGRLEKMNAMLDEYLFEHCEGMQEEDYDIEDEEFSLDGETEELQEFAMNFATDELAIRSLMLSSDSPYSNFEPETIKAMVKWYKEYGTKDDLDDCLFYKNHLDGIEADNPNLPLYIYAIKYIYSNNVNVEIEEWLPEFSQYAFQEIDANEDNIPTSNSTIMLKEPEIIKSLSNF